MASVAGSVVSATSEELVQDFGHVEGDFISLYVINAHIAVVDNNKIINSVIDAGYGANLANGNSNEDSEHR